MRYLTVDGYFDGTGIRDAANGGYLEHDEVGISPDLSKRIDVLSLIHISEPTRPY